MSSLRQASQAVAVSALMPQHACKEARVTASKHWTYRCDKADCENSGTSVISECASNALCLSTRIGTQQQPNHQATNHPLQPTMAYRCLLCHPNVVKDCNSIGNMKSHLGSQTLAAHNMGPFLCQVAGCDRRHNRGYVVVPRRSPWLGLMCIRDRARANLY